MSISAIPTGDGSPLASSLRSSEPAPAVDFIDLLYTDLVDKLAPALDAFIGKPLAQFGWRSRAATGASGQLDVSLVKVNRSSRTGAAQLVLDLHCEAKAGSSAVVQITLNPVRQSKHGTLQYRIMLGGNFRTWECATCENGELAAQTSFAPPKGLAALEHMTTVWFGSPQEAAKHGVSAGVERSRDPVAHELLARFWPHSHAASKKREYGLAVAPGLQVDGGVTVDAAEWAASVLVFCLWGLLLRTLSEPDESIPFDDLATEDAQGLPPVQYYWPRRSVDLTTSQVREALNREGLVIPWHIIEAACAALNAGKHVIFTGPPGCGKSKLSGVLATLATGREPLMVTASPAWTSGDLVGRYFPRRDGQGLEFKPGFFLRVIDEGNRWLVIDEFNRANIDECFGELFSVLADDVVDLPFEEEITDQSSDAGNVRVGGVRMLPARRGVRTGESSLAHSTTVDYAVGPGFRLIGTMNDADRSSLHQLSFALLRRFHIIRVEAPPAADVETVITTSLKRATQDLMLDQLAYRLTRKGKRSSSLELGMALPLLTELFARDLSKRKSTSYTDLVQERVVGLATVQDIIRFIAEGIRGPSQGKDANLVSADGLVDDLKLEEHAQATCASFLAIAVVLSVFPQLDALTADGRLAAVRHIIEVFQPMRESPALMRRVEVGRGDGESGLRLALIEHTDPTVYDFDKDRFVSIAEFLIEELCQQYRGTDDALEFGRLIAERVEAAE